MANDGSGVMQIGRVLQHLAEAPAMSVSALASALDMPRSTAFYLVRQLEKAGMAERDAAGSVTVGPEAARLGFSAYGLGSIVGPAEALIPILRDDTDATAALLVRRDGHERILLSRRAPWDIAAGSRLIVLEAPVTGTGGKAAAFVRLQLRPHAGAAEQASASASQARVAEALSLALAAGAE